MAKPKQKFDGKNESLDNVAHIGKARKFTPHDLVSFAPKTKRQSDYVAAFYSGTPIIIQDGYAGTGKTFTALYTALSKVCSSDYSNYTKVIIIRSAVETRPVGFIKGDLDEKQAVYESPYMSLSKECFKNFNDPYPLLKATNQLEFKLTTHLRGETFHDCIVIVDECQNMDYAELETVMTRAGHNCQMIFCGDDRQNDLSRTREKSGFGKLKSIIRSMDINSPYGEEMSATITYQTDDIVRSELVKRFIIAASQYELENQ